jgi:hypothetical protein
VVEPAVAAASEVQQRSWLAGAWRAGAPFRVPVPARVAVFPFCGDGAAGVWLAGWRMAATTHGRDGEVRIAGRGFELRSKK